MSTPKNICRKNQGTNQAPEQGSDGTPSDNGDFHDETRCAHQHRGCTYARDHAGPCSFENFQPRNYGKNPRRSTRRPPTAYVRIVTEDVNNACIEIQPDLKLTDIHTPETYEQATHKSNAHARYWWESMDKEMKDLQKHVTWGLVAREDVPKRHRVTKSRWVYAIKVKRDGTIDRFKSRFVVCGYSQIQGVDYTQSFSATLRATSMRTFLALTSCGGVT